MFIPLALVFLVGWYQTARAAGELYAVALLSGTHVFCISSGYCAILRTTDWRGWCLRLLVLPGPGKRESLILSMAWTRPETFSYSYSKNTQSHSKALVFQHSLSGKKVKSFIVMEFAKCHYLYNSPYLGLKIGINI